MQKLDTSGKKKKKVQLYFLFYLFALMTHKGLCGAALQFHSDKAHSTAHLAFSSPAPRLQKLHSSPLRHVCYDDCKAVEVGRLRTFIHCGWKNWREQGHIRFSHQTKTECTTGDWWRDPWICPPGPPLADPHPPTHASSVRLTFPRSEDVPLLLMTHRSASNTWQHDETCRDLLTFF